MTRRISPVMRYGVFGLACLLLCLVTVGCGGRTTTHVTTAVVGHGESDRIVGYDAYFTEPTISEPTLKCRFVQIKETCQTRELKTTTWEETEPGGLGSLVLFPFELTALVVTLGQLDLNETFTSKKAVDAKTRWENDPDAPERRENEPLPGVRVLYEPSYPGGTHEEGTTDQAGVFQEDMRPVARSIMFDSSAPETVSFTLSAPDYSGAAEAIRLPIETFIRIYEYWSGLGWYSQPSR
ncbi:MAG: hypothetical protein ABIM40_05325 [Pseudomonadota bacterium]